MGISQTRIKNISTLYFQNYTQTKYKPVPHLPPQKITVPSYSYYPMNSPTLQTGFKLTKDDIEILTHVYQCRLATIDHLHLLTNRSHKALYRRLAKLTLNQYLYRRRTNINEKYIYTINRATVPVLVEHGIANDYESVDLHMRRLRELKQLFLRHALMLTDIHATLRRATTDHHITLTDWKEGEQLHDSVIARDKRTKKKQKFPVRPDSLFILQDTTRPAEKNTFGFFLEADRSTTTNARFQNKIIAYQKYFEEQRHKKYGITSARVITITLTKARAENLAKSALEVLLKKSVGKFYYFTSVENLSIENPHTIFNNIFISPKDFQKGIRYQLIETDPNPTHPQ